MLGCVCFVGSEPVAIAGQHAFSFQWVHDCGETGCLFRLDQGTPTAVGRGMLQYLSHVMVMQRWADPTEHVDLIHENATLAAKMLATLKVHNASTFSPYRGPGEQNKDVAAACDAAIHRYGGFFGPFVNQSN
jgi:hypothetical protein